MRRTSRKLHYLNVYQGASMKGLSFWFLKNKRFMAVKRDNNRQSFFFFKKNYIIKKQRCRNVLTSQRHSG